MEKGNGARDGWWVRPPGRGEIVVVVVVVVVQRREVAPRAVRNPSCVCAIYNTLCQLFLNKDTDADDWRAVLVFSLYRDVLAAPLLYLCAFTHDSRAFKWFPDIDFPRVLSQAFLGIFCNQLASLLGIQLVGAVMASLVHLATPMFAMAIAVCWGRKS